MTLGRTSWRDASRSAPTMVAGWWSVHSARLSAAFATLVVAHEVRRCRELGEDEKLLGSDGRSREHLDGLVGHASRIPDLDRGQTEPDTPTTRDETYPLVAFPAMDGVWSDTPSENTMSESSETRDRLVTLCSYPLAA